MNVYLVGYHQSAFGKLYDVTLEQMLGRAALGALEAAGGSPEVVDTVSIAGLCAPLLNDQLLLAGLMAEVPGFAGKSIATAENACASGGQAILDVAHRLLAGTADVGLAVGIEKMRAADGRMDGKRIGAALGTASHPSEREGKTFVFPHLFAEIMARYMAAYGVTEQELAHVPATCYAHGFHNPLAHMKGKRVSPEDVLRIEGINRYIVPDLPLKTYECSQISDGYAALLLVNERGLAKLPVRPERVVRLAGFSQRTDALAVGPRGDDVLRPAGALAAVADAYAMAGITADDLRTAEVHDCFGIMGAMSAEILGKAEAGQGARYYQDGRASIDGGDCPINTSGGLIGKGHPIGATGVAMPGWLYWQLTGQVPVELQARSVDHAATFNIGGPICASVVYVLRPRG